MSAMPEAANMDTNRRPSGVDGLGDMSWGSHFCLFYESREDLLDFFLPFFRAGLENHMFCLCVASDPLIAEEIERAMRRAIPDFERYLAQGQIEITRQSDWYLKEGKFDQQRVLQKWKDKVDQALGNGFSGIRFAANIVLEKSEWESFVRYEGKVEETLHDLRIEGFCAYNLNHYSAANVLGIMRLHQFTLARQHGTWAPLEGVQLRRAREELLTLNNELEQRVTERTAELASTNEQLKAEIVEHRRVEEALRESEEKFSAAFRASPIALVITALDGKYVEMNQAFCDLVGYSRQELLGKTAVDLGIYNAETRQEWIEALEREGGVMINRELSFQVRSGISRTTLSSAETIAFHGVPHRLSRILDITERKWVEDALRRSEDHLRLVIDTIPIMTWSVLPDGSIDFLNQRWMDYTGLSLEQYVEEPTRSIHPEDIPRVIEKWLADTAAGESYEDEMRLQRADGEYRWFLVRTDPLRDESGKIVKWYCVSIDIDDRKRAEEEMNRQAARAGTLARIAARLNKQLDLDAVIHAVCEEAINTFKVSQAMMSLYDKKRDLLVYAGGVNIPSEYAAIMESITRSRFDDFLQAMGPIMVVPDIQSLPEVPNAEFISHVDVRTVVTAAMLRDQELIGVLAVGVNGHVREFDKDELTLLKAISDQAAQAIANALLLKAANEQHEQLRALSTKLVEAQEMERQALTTELHDRAGQNLTGLSINLQNMRALLSDETAETIAMKFDDAQALVEHITRQIRDIMAELHPPELEDYGLAVALETYAERAASRGNLELIADLPDLAPPPLPSDVLIALFRAAQEAISNALKHAHATQLEVSLQERDGSIRLRVEDDGWGFEPDSASKKEAQTWGLKIMRERIESIGGKVQIESEPGEGTRVIFEIERPS